MLTDREKFEQLMADFGAKMEINYTSGHMSVCVDANVGSAWFLFNDNGKFVSVETGE